MPDELSACYGDLLTGTYDCVDRIVLNAHFWPGHSPGGFRTWWRRLHDGSDEQLDNTHLMRMAGRFSRRVRAWAKARGIPVIDCKRDQRKHVIADQWRSSQTASSHSPQAACSRPQDTRQEGRHRRNRTKRPEALSGAYVNPPCRKVPT